VSVFEVATFVQAKYLSIDRTGTNYNSLDRAYGMSVRCIKSKPDTDTTGEYQAVVSGTLLRNVWLDRNLGATQKATSGTDSNAYGTYYFRSHWAWGNYL
jgi:hypothetical protein